MSESTLPLKFDALDPAVLDDPYPTYARLRDAGPLGRGAPGQWVVPRYAEVAELLRDRRLGAEFPESYQEISIGTGPAGSFRRRVILNRDPPEHTQLALLIGKAVHLRSSTPRVRELVDSLLDPLLEQGRMDALADLAFPLASTVLCELIGIPPEDRDALRPRILALGRAFIPFVPEDERAAVDETVRYLREYVGELFEERRRHPRGDLVSRMIEAERDEEWLSAEEALDNVVFLSFAGFETTVNLIAAGCSLLARHPEAAARLRADRSLVSSAVEEMLRYETPIQMTGRLVLEPVEIAGRTIRPGRTLLLLLGSANRDERRFPDPDVFDVGRDPNPHVAFGGGEHYCLGAGLARLEAQAVFERLVERTSALEPDGDLERERRPIFRGLRRVPIGLHAA